MTTLPWFDLDLLHTLSVLLRHRHVTQAAEELGVSQSAVSQRLKRLRELLSDELLVSSGNELLLTDRARAMEPALSAALESVRAAVESSQPFDPKTSTRTFTLATSDYGAFMILPGTLEPIRKQAPHIDLRLISSLKDSPDGLARGEIDLVVGGALPLSSDLVKTRVGEEGFVTLMRKGHPALRQRFCLETYLAHSHVLVAPRGTPGSIVDGALAQKKKKRHVAVTVPHFLTAPFIVERTDLLLTAPSGLAERFGPLLNLASRPVPFPLPAVAIEVVWHARSTNDPAHRWFRERVMEAIRGDEAFAERTSRRRRPTSNPTSR